MSITPFGKAAKAAFFRALLLMYTLLLSYFTNFFSILQDNIVVLIKKFLKIIFYLAILNKKLHSKKNKRMANITTLVL